MQKIITLIIIGITILFTNLSFGQTTKYKSVQLSMKNKVGNKWTGWSTPPLKYNALIVLNSDTNEIKIYPEEPDVTLTFDIVKVIGKSTDSEDNSILTFSCVDDDGEECNIKIIGVKKANKLLFEIEWEDLGFLYNIYPK